MTTIETNPTQQEISPEERAEVENQIAQLALQPDIESHIVLSTN